MRFLSGRAVNLAHSFTDDEDTLSVPAVSVSVWAEGNDTAIATGNASVDLKGNWSFNAGILDEGVYRVEWTGQDNSAQTIAVDTTFFEVTGGLLFSVKEARDSDVELSDATKYGADEIKHYREVIEDEFETITGRSFTPRVRRFQFNHDGTDNVWLGVFDALALKGLSGPNGALSVSDYQLDPSGLLEGLQDSTKTGTSLIENDLYTGVVRYGHEAVPPDIKRVALIRLRYLLAAESSGIPDRATSFVAAEGGTFTLATPGQRGYKTGIPDVDAVLSMYSYDILRDTMAVG